MPDLACWLELHAARLRQGFRGEAAYPLPPLAFSPPERELFQLAERLAEALRPVEPRPVWVASLYERLMGEADRRHRIPDPSPLRSRWWLGVMVGTAALGVWAYRQLRRLHAARP